MAIWSVVLATLLLTSCAALTAPSASISGEPEYTISNEGVRMLYVDPFDCKQPATPLSTWVIELDQPETVYSIQVSVVEGTINDEDEDVVVRVGGNNPLEAGTSSNSLCTLAEVNSTSSMLSFECQEPVSGSFISISRNDAGSMNVCAFTANLGFVTFAPANAPGPFVSAPAADLMIPKTPEQAYTEPADDPSSTTEVPVAQPTAEVPAPATDLPTMDVGSVIKTFLALDGELTPVPGPSAVLAPASAPIASSGSVLPIFSAASDSGSVTPAPAPAPVLAPDVAPAGGLPVFAAVNSSAESVSEVEAPTPAPVSSPALAPEAAASSTGLPIFAAQQTDGTPAPAPAPILAPVPAPDSSATTVFAAVQTPVPAPAPAPVAPTPAEETRPLISPSSPLLNSLEVPPTPSPSGLTRPSFAAQDPPSDSASARNAAGSAHTGHSLSGGAIAGIVIGCVVGVALIAAVALYITRHHDFSGRSRFSSNV